MGKIAAVMFCVGALDYALGNRLKLGDIFFEGISTIPPLLMLMTGFMALAPWIGSTAAPILTPFFTALGCDPSLIAGIFLGCDAGGAVLAEQLAVQPAAGLYNGMVLGAYLGCATTCSIPLALSNTRGDTQKAAVSGLLAAFVLLPPACIFTGLLCGFPIKVLAANTWPVLVASLVLMLLFLTCRKVAMAVFCGMALLVRGAALTGFSISVIQETFGWVILPGLMPLDQIFPVICRIGVFLAGILPLLAWIRGIVGGPIASAGQKLGLNQEEIMGFVLSLANSIPVLTSLGKMSPRGVMLNTAFLTVASFALGDHLAFSLQFSPEIALPLMLGKLISGGVVLAMAVLALPILLPEERKKTDPPLLPRHLRRDGQR